ncbi:glycosyltransferase [Mucilaginibacter xinganensis]|uniref:Glycosyl transferases group 1 n=1 Tax=Mucilaginibacter xinganensis TaxID=1234841 RepID=A0A223NZ26_9SPHI|nr:glycosyltransferase [Mucilaginibacter xinganensis]ASU35137.1 Glycosyl transferases group 1 [Mucilaginibacter xinganensis]
MKKLFYNLRLTGHHSEYVGHLIDYLGLNKDDNRYIFVLHPEFSNKFPQIADKAKQIENVTWITVTADEYRSIEGGGMLKKTFSEYQLMNRYAVDNKVDAVCLLYFNTFQLACVFYRPSYSISGILFLQFFRMEQSGLRERIKYYRKYLTTLGYSINPKIKSVFILNDAKAGKYLNNTFKTAIFKMLPDPIPELLPMGNFDIYAHYNIERGRKIFLHIGGLCDRKGTFEIIDAAQFITGENQAKVAILLVGKPASDNTGEIIATKIKDAENNTKVQVIWDNKFISNPMMKSIFDQSAVVLIPYKNTEASSGILGHAIAANKNVIATGKGLIKELIEENNFGVLIKEVTPGEIASKIESFLPLQSDTHFSSAFLKAHTPQEFAELVILN